MNTMNATERQLRPAAVGLAVLTAQLLAFACTGIAVAQEPAGTSAAQERAEPRRPVQVDLRAGLQYDSNVAILDLDESSGRGDLGAQLEFGVNYNVRPAPKLTVNSGYHLSQTLHREYDAFDLRIHRGSAGFGYDAGRFNTGLAAHHIIAELGGDGFLVMRQYSPHLSRLFGSRLFMRFAHTYTEKTFRRNPDRNATAHALSADAYVFLNGLRTYLVLGLRHDDEDAVSGHFDFRGDRLRAQLVHRIEAGARDLTLRTQVRTERRDYREPTPVIGEERRDRRRRIELSLDLPLNDRVVTRFGYVHADNRSNLAAVDFSGNLLSVQMRAVF